MIYYHQIKVTYQIKLYSTNLYNAFFHDPSYNSIVTYHILDAPQQPKYLHVYFKYDKSAAEDEIIKGNLIFSLGTSATAPPHCPQHILAQEKVHCHMEMLWSSLAYLYVKNGFWHPDARWCLSKKDKTNALKNYNV